VARVLTCSHSREQQHMKSEPCSELELISIRACAATLCCGIIKDEWFQKTVIPWLDQFMAAHEVTDDRHVNRFDSYSDKDVSIEFCKYQRKIIVCTHTSTSNDDY
jgi:hypothetical protein